MKKILAFIMVAVVLMGVSFSTKAFAKTWQGDYYLQRADDKRLDEENILITHSFTNTSKKTIKNIVLEISVRDINRRDHEYGFLFLGDVKAGETVYQHSARSPLP